MFLRTEIKMGSFFEFGSNKLNAGFLFTVSLRLVLRDWLYPKTESIDLYPIGKFDYIYEKQIFYES